MMLGSRIPLRLRNGLEAFRPFTSGKSFCEAVRRCFPTAATVIASGPLVYDGFRDGKSCCDTERSTGDGMSTSLGFVMFARRLTSRGRSDTAETASEDTLLGCWKAV